MEVYLVNIEIPINVFNLQYIYFIDNSEKYLYKNNIMYGLYAWTTNKDILDEFMETRNKEVFKVTTEKVKKKDLKYLKKNYDTHELDWYIYKYKEKGELKDIGIITTLNEYNTVNSSDDFIMSHTSYLEDKYLNVLNEKLRKSVLSISEILSNRKVKVTECTMDKLFYLFRFMFVGTVR